MSDLYFAEFWHRIEFDTALERIAEAAIKGAFDKFIPIAFGFALGYLMSKELR